MQSYREYPIRCKSCNNQIACFSNIYEDLVKIDGNCEDALNQMGVDNWCCRASYVNPPLVTHDMENRDLIEGRQYINNAGISFPSARKARSSSVPTKNIPAEEREQVFIDPLDQEEFKVPLVPGVSVINNDSTIPPVYMSAGIGKSLVLNGRTYLAR